MGFKINKIFLLIILILLQSCSGGRIGKFLESSFKNVEEPKIKEDIKNNIVIKSERNIEKKQYIKKPKIKEDIKNNIVIKSERNIEEKQYIKKTKIKEDTKNNLNNNKIIKTEEKLKNNKKIKRQNISSLKKQYQPQSYKIIFILKDVDPKDPIEDLSTILRNSEVNFEIEKIERFFDSKDNKIKSN